MKSIDTEKIEKNIRQILIALGDNPDREGLAETPKRVANMYKEVFEGMRYSNEEVAEMFDKTFEEETGYTVNKSKNMVVVQDIPIFSFCEHHLALMYNMKVAVGYIPNKKIIGLSKIARIAEMVAKRLQLQERIGRDIAEVMAMVANTDDVAVVIEGEHSCMTSRGIKKGGALTKTSTFKGKFEEDNELRNEFLLLVK
ncbi:GTP cyclohydrolase I FolE [Proteinivorax hydrogeniformans]|uniref:GTP cyclohydrolase 1 n=1 Tax=Proteinivorax hydrogeniformans TaxID=1826727 RepID=A0AAU8HRW6_9FIRM